MAKKIGYAQALQALESMTEQLGLEGGLHGWEMLAQRMEAASQIPNKRRPRQRSGR